VKSASKLSRAVEPQLDSQNDNEKPGSIIIQGVSKTFRKATRKSYSSLKTDILNKLLRRSSNVTNNTLTALKTLDLEIKPGTSIGIIGRNGSGKSTLLKLISGIYKPDTGTVNVNGKISALIELGAGFHPEFSGRENIYLGGVMYGLTRKEIDQRFDKIVEYSELADFIDDPVKTYSSGMYMRLGFSLAVHTDPDILLIDEVLAVGDAGFISRCYDTISDFKRRGKTLVFVTHDLTSVEKWCDDVVWLDKGNVIRRGEARWVIDGYLQKVGEDQERNLEEENQNSSESLTTVEDPTRWGSKEVELVNVKMIDQDNQEVWLFSSEQSVTVEVEYKVNKEVEDLVFGVGIVRVDGLAVHGVNTELDRVEVPSSSMKVGRTGKYRYAIDRLSLTEGSYFLDVAAHRKDGYPFDFHHRRHRFQVKDRTGVQGICNPGHRWEIG
jgi:lipopolysaccharide transport system ATP-binding protein